jgi:hypothetical protein
LDALGAGPSRRTGKGGPGRPDRPHWTLDGRHDDHGARRAGAGTVQGAGRRRGVRVHVGRPAQRGHVRAAELVSRFNKPLLPVVRGAGRLTTAMADRARRASRELARLLTQRYASARRSRARRWSPTSRR